MEKQRFGSVHKTFNYTPKIIFTNRLTNLAYAIGMIVVPLVYPFGIRIRRAEILSAEVFSTILIVGGSFLLLFTLFNIWTAHTLVAQGGTIRIKVDESLTPW